MGCGISYAKSIKSKHNIFCEEIDNYIELIVLKNKTPKEKKVILLVLGPYLNQIKIQDKDKINASDDKSFSINVQEAKTSIVLEYLCKEIESHLDNLIKNRTAEERKVIKDLMEIRNKNIKESNKEKIIAIDDKNYIAILQEAKNSLIASLPKYYRYLIELDIFLDEGITKGLTFEERKEMVFQKPFKIEFNPIDEELLISIADIKGQESAKRALTVAAAGGHNILMFGPPGAGKTMLAQALVSILPSPSLDEIIETTQIYSAAGALGNNPFVNFRPFRAPHHSASMVSVIGGGANPKPGEISLAHRGVLFLDEIPEFRRDLLESLRQPLESGNVCISRAKGSLDFPAKFSLVAAMNPCPCGYFGVETPEKECQCTANEVFRYQKKISGPLLDRIDIQIEVPRIRIEELRKEPLSRDNNINKKIKDMVLKAREIQKNRFAKIKPKIYLNSEMSSKMVDEIIALADDAEPILKNIMEKSFISARGYYRVLKIAQTIADLENSEKVRGNHLAEAFQYRVREKG